MTDKQRVVVSVAGGLMLVVLAVWWNQRSAMNSGGWFSYSPEGGTVYSGEPSGGRAVLVWIGAVAIWGGGSFWRFRSRANE